MIQFRDNLAINSTQADAAFGLVAAADIDHRALHRGKRMSPPCTGKRRRTSSGSYSRSTVPVSPVCECVDPDGVRTGSMGRSLWRPGQTGGPVATVWATFVIQRALSS